MTQRSLRISAYDAIQDIRGVGDDAAVRIDSIDVVAADLGLEVVVPDVDPVGDGPVDSSAAGPAPITSTTTTTIAPPVALREVDAGSPLTVFVGGDSQAEYLAQAITTESDLALQVESQFEIATSLARPDYFNWPARLLEIDDALDPEAIVLFIGGNDDQDMSDDEGTRFIEGSVEWRNEWSRRLAITFDLLEQPGRHIFWVTQPPMRDGDLDSAVGVINELAAAVIAERDFVSAIDIWPLFGGDAGFSERIVGPDGADTRARVDDGVHLTRSASSWVADLVFAELTRLWSFTP